MKVVKFKDDPATREAILEKLKTRRFIAISFDDQGNTEDHWHMVNNQEAIFQLEVLKYKIMQEIRGE